MALHKEIITSVVSRCKASTIRDTLERWGRLSRSQLRDIGHGSKRQIAERVFQMIQKDELNDEIVGDLELAYMQLNSRSKLWMVYKVTGSDVHLSLDPRTLRSKVQHSLQLQWQYGHVSANMSMFAGAVWLRVHLDSGRMRRQPESRAKLYNPNNSVFVLTFQGSPYLLISRAGIRHTKALMETLTSSMHAESLKKIQLSGHHVSSLADIVLKKDNEALSRMYTDREQMENPLSLRQERKRKVTEAYFVDTVDMADENRLEKHLRREELDQKFGCKPQPVLEKLEYKFLLKFHGQPVSDTECKSWVQLKGTSVLDGLYQLALAGLVKVPLPKHLTAVTSSARNNFTIESRKK